MLGQDHVVKAMGQDHVVKAMGQDHVGTGPCKAMGQDHVVKAMGQDHVAEALEPFTCTHARHQSRHHW